MSSTSGATACITIENSNILGNLEAVFFKWSDPLVVATCIWQDSSTPVECAYIVYRVRLGGVARDT
jgi:hypothetical protein